MRHPTLASIQWQDLRQLSAIEATYNVLLSLPFLLLSWFSAYQGWWLIALTASFFFFTAALRQAHDCYHRTLGVSKTATELMLFALSVTMLCSTHAIRHTHLNHHRDPLGDSDVEGNWARLPWYQAILGGGIFSIAIQWFGLTHGSRRNRLLVAVDMLLIITVISAAMITMHPVLVYHVVIMLMANMMVGFFAVWSVHHGCDEIVYARSERHPLINLLTFNLLYHIEHHLFPAVPTNHLPKLAERLDRCAPQWTQQPVLPMLTSKQDSHEKVQLTENNTQVNSRVNSDVAAYPRAPIEVMPSTDVITFRAKKGANTNHLSNSDKDNRYYHDNDCPLSRSIMRLLLA